MAPPDNQRPRHTTPTTTTRDRIIDAAAQVMATKGLAHTTTKEIARAAGYSEAALYKHFQDKAELFFCVMRERLPTGFIETLATLPRLAGHGIVRANLEEVARSAVPFYAQGIPMMAATFSEPSLLARHKKALRDAGVGPHLALVALTSYLRAEQRLGRVVKGIRPEAAAAALLGACFQRAFHEQFVGAHIVHETDERFAKNVVRTLLSGIAPED